MILTLEPNITRELILSKVPEEQLMEHYLGIPVKRGLFISPLRQDKKPTCSFYRNKKGVLIFKDFAGYFSGDFVCVVMNKFSCSKAKALRIIANDFNIINDSQYKVNPPRLIYTGNKLEEKTSAVIRVEIQEFSQSELLWWKSYGISKETLNHFQVFSCKNVFLNGELYHIGNSSQKVFGYFGGTRDKIEQWKVYFPSRTSHRFLCNWKANQIQGARQLSKDGGDLLVITKSLKDCMTLYEYGITAIAPNSETIFISKAQYNKLKSLYKHIFVLYDNDLAGIEGMKRIKKLFPDTQLMFIPLKYKAKDISDFRKKYGDKKTFELINTAKNYYLYGKE